MVRHPFYLLLRKTLQHCNLLGPAALVGRLEDERNVVETGIARNVPKGRYAQMPLAHRRVAIDTATWTVVTLDGSLSAHYENTIAITDGEPELLSWPDYHKEEKR